MFKDVIKKEDYYKEEIIKEFINKGQFPKAKDIEEKLSKIDSYMSIFKYREVKEGTYFDTERFNTAINEIYKDLEIIYDILKSITSDDYIALKAYIDTHLNSLEDTAEMYRIKTEQESNSTSLGRTLFFQDRNYNITSQNDNHIIDLGELEVNKGARIACIINANNIEADKILFGLKKEDEDTLYSAAYNYNQDSLVVPGDVKLSKYITQIKDNQIIEGPIQLNTDDMIPNEKNLYLILGGKDKVVAKELDSNSIQVALDRPTKLNMLYFDTKTYIEFYTVGANEITFRFNRQPLSANFDLNTKKISNLDNIHRFFLQCDSDFAFDFELDQGDVYAVREYGEINNDKVYFTREIDIKDFVLNEYYFDEKEKYNAFVRIINDSDSDIEINSILIKELLEVDSLKGVVNKWSFTTWDTEAH